MLVKENLYEFERGMKPKRALGISIESRIEKWLEHNNLEQFNYHIDYDLNIVFNAAWSTLYFKGDFPMPPEPVKLIFPNDVRIVTDREDILTKIIAKGNISINGNITYIPEELTFNKSLNLSHTNSLEKLYDNMTVNGILNLAYSSLDKLPNNLKVKKSLIISGSNISELPPDLYVGGNIYMTDMEYKVDIPESVYIGKDILK